MSKTILELPCPICGQINYKRGEVAANNLRFHLPIKLNYDKKGLSALLPQIGNTETMARICLSCGNVQIFMYPLPKTD